MIRPSAWAASRFHEHLETARAAPWEGRLALAAFEDLLYDGRDRAVGGQEDRGRRTSSCRLQGNCGMAKRPGKLPCCSRMSAIRFALRLISGEPTGTTACDRWSRFRVENHVDLVRITERQDLNTDRHRLRRRLDGRQLETRRCSHPTARRRAASRGHPVTLVSVAAIWRPGGEVENQPVRLPFGRAKRPRRQSRLATGSDRGQAPQWGCRGSRPSPPGPRPGRPLRGHGP